VDGDGNSGGPHPDHVSLARLTNFLDLIFIEVECANCAAQFPKRLIVMIGRARLPCSVFRKPIELTKAQWRNALAAAMASFYNE
jgi:hypothetical protein